MAAVYLIRKKKSHLLQTPKESIVQKSALMWELAVLPWILFSFKSRRDFNILFADSKIL